MTTKIKVQLFLLGSLACWLALAAICLVGCSTPSPYLFTPVTNVVSEVVVPRTNTVTVTNVLTEVVTRTNLVGTMSDGSPKYEIVISPIERLVLRDASTVIFETNRTVDVVWQVSTNATGLAKAAGSVVNIFAPGIGNMVTQGILGLGGIVATMFARRYKKVGETMVEEKQNALEQAAAGFAQGIQTYREVVRSTPQGAIVDEKLKSWMQGHQRELGIIDIAANAVENYVDHDGARKLAAEVQAEAARLLGGTSPAK